MARSLPQGSHFATPRDGPENCRLPSRRAAKLAGVTRALFLAVVAFQIGATALTEAQQVRTERTQFVGAAGCKSSSCHGGAGEKRSQYITWLRHDIHTRAYAILTNARSERMADALQLPGTPDGSPRATQSARCTICHSPFQAIPPARRLPAADPTESVSCESCHGAAGGWLRGHTRKDWTYATRVGAGMRDLRSFYVRANTCVACHQNLDTDILAAGHPELLFELDSQSVAEPKHWQDEPGTGVRAWLVGQAVALRELSWRLSVAPASDPARLSQWQALAWLLAEVTGAERTLLPIESPAANNFARIQQQADALARRATQQDFNAAFASRLQRHLAGLGRTFRDPTGPARDDRYRQAQRLVLALERLAAPNRAPSAELIALRGALRYPEAFDPATFATQLEKLEATL